MHWMLAYIKEIGIGWPWDKSRKSFFYHEIIDWKLFCIVWINWLYWDQIWLEKISTINQKIKNLSFLSMIVFPLWREIQIFNHQESQGLRSWWNQKLLQILIFLKINSNLFDLIYQIISSWQTNDICEKQKKRLLDHFPNGQAIFFCFLHISLVCHNEFIW
jgi:hypothetical protein